MSRYIIKQSISTAMADVTKPMAVKEDQIKTGFKCQNFHVSKFVACPVQNN